MSRSSSPRRPRRRHGADLKARILAACAQPGASVRAIALEHGLNPSVVHDWRRKVAVAAVQTTRFIELPLSPDTYGIRIELQRAGTSITVTWPLSAAAHCGTWLREVLQ
jgi:transposase